MLEPAGDSMYKISINKHSSIKLSGDKTVYFDPWGLPADSEKADVVFVTHSHYDHYIPEDIAKVVKKGTVVVVPLSMRDVVEKETLLSDVTKVFVRPGEAAIVAGIEFEAVASYNPAKQFHPKANGWCGYVVKLAGKSYYVTGDMDVTPEAKAVKCDVLLLPIGGKFTMNVEEAVTLVEAIKPELAVPTHYADIIGELADGERFKTAVEKLCPEVKVELVI